jgi:type I restriction enzyme, S subunit
MNDDLPAGWTAERLENLVSPRKGKKPTFLSDHPVDGFVPYLDIHAVEKKEIRQFADIESSRIAYKNDVLVVWDGARSGWVGTGIAGAIGSTMMALTPHDVEAKYLRFFLATQFETINRSTRGTGIPHVDPEVFWNLNVPLAPSKEQRRIVAKLEKLLDKVDSCQKRLAKIPILLKRFRESVLAAACSGRLTEDWREENRSAGSLRVEDVSRSLSDERDFPNEWCTTNLGILAKLVTSGSRGWAKYYAESGSIFIRAQNINSDILDLDQPAYVQLPESCEGLRTKVQLHDILITITGANVTKSALVQTHIEDAYVSQHVALLRLKDVRVSEFVFLSLLSPMHGRQQLRSLAYGQGKPGLNLDNIRSVVLALPPVSEQNEIVRLVKQLFALADQIEARYEKGKEYVDDLKQSILAKAFRGELVPQDPNDEPATALLERIREARATQPANRSRRMVNKSNLFARKMCKHGLCQENIANEKIRK